MDEFLRDINTLIFKEWILIQDQKDYQIHLDEQQDNVIVIHTDYSHSQITFNPLNIIELCVTNTTNQEVEFYLHFQMKTMKHAIELFHEMIESILQLVEKPKVRILLSCSGGLTTSYFASKLNEASELLYLNYEVRAVGYNQVFDIGHDYDVIILAPQISYMHAKAQEIFKNQIVIKIPPHIFAKYDVAQTLNLIEEALNNKQQKVEPESKPLSLQTTIHNDTKILVLSIFRNSLRVHIAYRIYDEKNHILLDNEIIKPKITIQDIYDIIDTAILHHPDIKIIGVSTPGIINDGYVVSANVEGLEDMDFMNVLSSRYSQIRFILSNDVNTAAVGYYASQKEYHSLSFLFQPTNHLAGAGMIIKGQLIRGRAHLAGEVQYLPMSLSDDRLALARTPEGALELVTMTILSIISIISPQVIVLCCVLIPDVEELKKELGRYLPKHYIPDIIKVDILQEYTLLGQLILCIQGQD